MFKKIIALIILSVFFSGCVNFNNFITKNEEIRGVWISYLDLKKPLSNSTKEGFESDIDKIIENCKNHNLNTVFVHLRPFGDSLYESELFPKSSLIKGDYDPFEIITKKAKKEGIAVHGWINPMRCMTTEELLDVADSFPVKEFYKNNKNVFEYEGRIYLNPATEETRKLITDGVLEIIDNYDIDGIHIDDYFYPANLPFEYDNSNGNKRRESTDELVKTLCKTVKEKGLVFTISPTGNSFYNYHSIFSDSKKWAKEDGYCDYIIPQIYYGFENENLPFDKTLDEWCSVSDKVITGLAAYKVGFEDKYAGEGINEWKEDSDILSRQIEKSIEKTNGYVLFRYDSLNRAFG